MEGNFYSMNLNEIYKKLDSNEKGLGEEEAKKRIWQHGYNEIEEKKKAPSWVLFLNQFKSFLIAILIIAAIISVVLGELIDAVVISIIIVLNAILGFVQERKAEHALEALKKISAPNAEVVRNGDIKKIPARELVPGDVIVLKAGDKIPADCRIVEEMNLKTDESILTGESLPVRKHANRIDREVQLPERKNMLFSGTTVVYGRCKAVIIATGMKTEFGKIASMLQVGEEQTPLQKNLAAFGRQLGLMTVIICAIIFSTGVALGEKISEMFLTSVALAVAAIPEGLPAIVTITLAIGLQRMVKRNAIIRKLPAVETLGATTVICSDKTGTLTMNEMTVKKLYVYDKIIGVAGEGYSAEGRIDAKDEAVRILLEAGLFCNDAIFEETKKIGDPTEIALLVSAKKSGMEDVREKYPRTSEIPFDSERKMMSVAYSIGNTKIMYTKGAVEEILKKSTHIYKDGMRRTLTSDEKKKILSMNTLFAKEAMRVLAFAYKDVKDDAEENNLIFIGLQAMIDPPRPEVKNAIERCRTAGIKAVMITGDHKDTAIAVAKELGLIDGSGKPIDDLRSSYASLTGDEIDKLDDAGFEDIVENVAVYARVSPEHKVRIVEALKKKGHVVAMTGDGVNDSPALKKSDIGIAMGISGTDVSKEASDMVLTDDNFSSIVAAVEEGRGIYDNIKKFITYLLAANIGEVLVIFTAILISIFTELPLIIPLLPLQILWMNLITDGLPALALGVEPPEPDVMKRKPRNPKEKILGRPVLIYIFAVGAVYTAGTLFLFYSELPHAERARTIAFTALIMFEMFHALAARSYQPLHKIGLFSNKKLLIAIVASVALQVAVVQLPFFDAIFDTVPLSLIDWIKITLVSSSILIVLEAKKILLIRRHK